MKTNRRGEKGFTLVELLTVVAIIAVLATVAIPVLAGYRVKAFNSSATTDLRNFRTTLEAVYIDKRGYPAM
ncbi:MAG TPA: prepilin-type N-terminal cleavage/methylation domain-containing protein [Desulfuromonadales bacterium]|nr:prepilin-type N-terminal cleavage/methylation domain-containing protein [Desulfuromonadales bacterium]